MLKYGGRISTQQRGAALRTPKGKTATAESAVAVAQTIPPPGQPGGERSGVMNQKLNDVVSAHCRGAMMRQV